MWLVGEPYQVFVNAYEYRLKQDFTYLRNLSKDLEKAKRKVRGNYTIDLELKGASSFTRTSPELFNNFAAWQFTFGRLQGEDIRTCTDVWQISRAWNNEKDAERREYARNRLIELGELREYEGEYLPESVIALRKKNKMMKSGHYHKDGERVTLNVTLVERFSFDTNYGTMFINVFRDADGNVYKYKGGTPPNLSNEDGVMFDDAVYTLSATIKHDQYKGEQETLLQRIKVVAIKI